jgi:hypothetical protein
MASLTSLVHPDMLANINGDIDGNGNQDPLELVVIGNGSHTLITKYRQIFAMPFSLYTDPTQAIYEALGMRLMNEACVNSDAHIDPRRKPQREKEATVADSPNSETGGSGYVRHGMLGGIAIVVMRALRVGMPVWEKGGEIRQLGGEFVFGPG